MAYKRIKNKTYNNVMYLANLIRTEKGYPFGVAARIALDNFDDNGFRWQTVGCLMGNLITYKEHIERKAMHDFNKMLKGDKLVTREKFLKKYNKELNKDEHGKIYGNDVTIHWNGMFCTCEDGATAYNHIICGLEDAMTELDDEE